MNGCPCKMSLLPPTTDPLSLYRQAVAADGVSFAIPADAVREIVWQFHHHGRVVRPFVGITLSELTNGEGCGGGGVTKGGVITTARFLVILLPALVGKGQPCVLATPPRASC